MHIVTLSFDDGFKKSNLRTAAIYESFGMSACFNVMATGHIPGAGPLDQYHLSASEGLGDFGLWNELSARGHEVMPHGYTHIGHHKIPLAEAQGHVLKCLDYFGEHLRGFDRKRAVFNMPGNGIAPELDAWIPTVVRAVRGGFCPTGINPLPEPQVKVLRTTGFGPGNCEHHFDQCLEELLKQPDGWLIYNTHGLDEESWGPIGSDYLKRLLERLTRIGSLKIIPAAKALMEGDALP